MKKFILIPLFIGLLISCSSETSTPEENAEKFLLALGHGDFKEAKKFCTEET